MIAGGGIRRGGIADRLWHVVAPGRGRSLTELGHLATHSVTMSAATSTFTPGTGRFAFALPTSSGSFLYGPTEIYIARSARSPAQGPFPATADSMDVAPRYRKGLRPQLKALHLRTEPWVFAIDRHGVIVDRLEGAFGLRALTAALRAAIGA